MDKFISLFLFVGVLFISCKAEDGELCFPDGFRFGIGNWPFLLPVEKSVSPGSDGNGTCRNQYPNSGPVIKVSGSTKLDDVNADQYKNDVELLLDLGVQYYKFAISWTRVLPNGHSNKIDPDGVKYYSDLIDELLEHNIEPLVSMYHWELPQYFEDLGGWTNPTVADYFVDYARVLFDSFGNRVKNWITFNDPHLICTQFLLKDDIDHVKSYLCGHTVLIAHGKVYNMYQEEFKNKQEGNISISFDYPWIEPASDADNDTTQMARHFHFSWFGHPILSKDGDYHPVMRQRVDELSEQANYSRSRLPVFTPDEIDMIRGSYDFLGLNHYSTFFVTTENVTGITLDDNLGFKLDNTSNVTESYSDGSYAAPWGLKQLLIWIKQNYDNPPILITENGVESGPGTQDVDRISYIDGYLKELYSAVVDEGCNVLGYTLWSLMDNFECQRFGLYEVDFDSPNRTVTPRISSEYYSKIAQTGCIPPTEDFDLTY